MESNDSRFTNVSGMAISPDHSIGETTMLTARYVPVGTVVTTQAQADALPEVTEDYAYTYTN